LQLLHDFNILTMIELFHLFITFPLHSW